MKLTKLQRHTAYILMLLYIEENTQEFICLIIKWVFDIDGHGDDVIRQYFPELWSKKPQNAEYSWFVKSYEENKKGRIEIINQAIKETY